MTVKIDPRLSRLEEIGEILGAKRPQDLWCALLLQRSSDAETSPWMAVAAFQSLHSGAEPGAFDSAVLLCTARRWRRVTHLLIADILKTGILTESDLDRLAAAFLTEDELKYSFPSSWLGTSWIEVDLGRRGHLKTRRVRSSKDERSSVRRRIPPPLRRWASSHTLRRRPADLKQLLATTRGFGSRDAAAIVASLVDAADALDQPDAHALVDLSLTWPSRQVRTRALEAVTARDGEEAAKRIARDDPDSKIRAWGSRPPARPMDTLSQTTTASIEGGGDASGQLRLFDSAASDEGRQGVEDRGDAIG
jgi:hypothetical protein